MESFTSEDARRDWRRVLDKVQRGEQVGITRYGDPLAVIIPADRAAMKLYVWEDVLRDYGSGMIVAVAPDLESALATADSDRMREEMGRVTPTVVEIGNAASPQLWHVWGGG
jgi:prevent-host-death family protein